MTVLDRSMVAVALAAALWWAVSRRRQPSALEALSVGALVLAVATVVVDGLHWQLVPWQVLAVAVATAAALRRFRPGHSAPLAARSRQNRPRLGRCGRWGRSANGLRARFAQAGWPSPGRQRDLPLDRQSASGDPDCERIGPQAGRCPGVVSDRSERRSCGSVLRGPRELAGVDRWHRGSIKAPSVNAPRLRLGLWLFSRSSRR
jgi:hypothetical protein